MLRRGQKVVCIVNFAMPGCVTQLPVKDAIYTIRDIINVTVRSVFGEHGPFEQLLLYELRNGRCACLEQAEAAFSVNGFRPIVEDAAKIDISVFKKIERGVDAPITPDLEPVAFRGSWWS